MYDALGAAVQQMGSSSGRQVIIALTDGLSNSGQHTARSSARYAVQEGIPIYTIGLGSDADEQSLKQIADNTGGEYYFAPGPSDLERLYTDLAQALQNEYHFNYTSPTPQLDGTRRDIAITVRRPAGDLVTSSDYAVSGVLAVNHNPLLLALLASGLIALLAAPSLARRVRTSKSQLGVDASTPAELPLPRSSAAWELEPGSVSAVAQPLPAAITTHSVDPLPAVTLPPLILRYTVPIQSERLTIGSGADNDLVLRNLAPQHALITRQNGQWVVTARDKRTAVRFNGATSIARSVSGSNALKHESVIELEGQHLLFQSEPPALIYELSIDQPVTLGSTTGMLAQPLWNLRPQHARLDYAGNRWFVEDLSDGLTKVSFNGDPSQLRTVTKSALKPGSLVSLGSVMLQVVA